jgi:hypothetical protein
MLQHVSHEKAGVSDITKEITSPDNDRFVLHESQGFASGEVKNLKTAIDFIKERQSRANIADNIHAIWCVYSISCVCVSFKLQVLHQSTN